MTDRTPAIRLRQFAHSAKGQLAICLAILLWVAMALRGPRMVWAIVLAAPLAAMAVDAPILRLRRHRWVFPDGALLTGLIVAMVLAPHEPWWVAAITAAVAVLSKYAWRVRKANVLNPAALGLVATFYVFNTAQDWWGGLGESSPALILILVAVGAYLTWRVHKEAVVLTFLGGWFLLVTAAAFIGNPAHFAELYRTPDVNAALYFAFIIATDPPTSPASSRDQVWFGLITAVVSFVVFEFVGAAYFFLAGILVANLWAAWRRHARANPVAQRRSSLAPR